MEAYPSIGVDLGQRHDPTAIVVVEASRRHRLLTPTGDGLMRTAQPIVRQETIYAVRELGRLPLGTPYPDVYKYILAVIESLKQHNPRRPRLLVDATGAIAAVDALREVLRGVKVTLCACTFTYGDRYVKGGTYYHPTASVGKAFLCNRVETLLQTGQLELPPNKPEAAALRQELRDYEIRIDPDANEKYGAFKVGAHDDLVTALGLAVLDDPVAEARRGTVVVHRGWPHH